MKNNIYTHDEAARIIELFEEILCANDIIVPSPEDDEKDDDNAAVLYGSTYSDLLDDVEEALLEIVKKAKSGQDVIPYEFSGTY